MLIVQPGSNNASENEVDYFSPFNDVIDQCGGIVSDEDEDDHDPAGIRIVDLALRKTVISTPPFLPGSNVSFQIEVFNQGNVPVEEVLVVEYLPEGMDYGFSNFPTWNYDPFSGNAAAVINTPILPGQSQSLIFSVVLDCVEDGDYLTGWDNCSEIYSFKDENGDKIPSDDKDSNADFSPSNDAGGAVLTDADNYIDGLGTGAIGGSVAGTDEDDHDCERIQIFDLALKKEIVTLASLWIWTRYSIQYHSL